MGEGMTASLSITLNGQPHSAAAGSIADLVRSKTIEGITDLRDESDKDGMRIVIELRRGEEPEEYGSDRGD